MTDPNSATAVADEAGYARWWNWEEDSDTCAGTFVRFERGHTKNYGAKVIAILDVEGEERSLWLNETVLRNKFKRELEDRPDHNLRAGERIVVSRLEMKQNAAGTSEYRDFRVLFPDRPVQSASELFGLDEPAESADKPAGDDDIPF